MSYLFSEFPQGLLNAFPKDNQREVKQWLGNIQGAGKIHTHANVEGSGQLAEDALLLTDVTTNNSSATKHGFCPKLSDTATQFLDGTGSWDSVKDSDLSVSDITTNDVSISAHGFTPKAPNDTAQVLLGDASWGTLIVTNIKIYSQDAEPAIANDTCCLWEDTDAGPAYYFLADFGGIQKKMALV